MRINEVVEASYPGNIGFEEVLKFFVVAEREDPKLAQEVEQMIENDQDQKAWKIIQEFLAVKLRGPQFECLREWGGGGRETSAERDLRRRKDLDELERELRAAGFTDEEIRTAITDRRLSLANKRYGNDSSVGKEPHALGSTVPRKKVPVHHIPEPVEETATAGGTSAGNIASIANPHVTVGKEKKSWAGKPGKMGKSPAQPQGVQKKNADGTAKGAHELKGASLFGGPAVKR